MGLLEKVIRACFLLLCSAFALASDPPVAGSSTSVAVVSITDDAEPISSRVVLGTTAFTGDVDVTVRHEAGSLWVTWREVIAESVLGQ